MDLVSGLLETADGYLVESLKAGKPAQEVTDLISDANKLAGLAYLCLEFMSGSGSDDLPYPVVAPLQRWFDQLALQDSTFFRAELVVNYELRTLEEDQFKGIRNPAPSLSAAIAAIHWPLRRVTVPSKAFGILPHFAIVAHEIGHALFARITWDLSTFIAAEEAALIARICARLKAVTLNAQTLKKLNESFASWHEELAADAFCFFLTGPASFFSMSEFLGFSGTYGLSRTHPANDLRRKALFEKLAEGGTNSFAEVFKTYTGQVLTEDFNSALIKATPSKDEIANDYIAKHSDSEWAAALAELHESMPKAVPLIFDHVETFMKANAPAAMYTRAMYEEDLKTHLNPILAAIPPIESGSDVANMKAATFASILNVGWVASLTKLDDVRVKTATNDPLGTEKLQCLHGLLLKAVELSEVRRTWEAA